MTNYTYQDNLDTPRLKTRCLTPNDVEAWAEFFEDKEATEFLPNFGFTTNIERAKHWVEKQIERYNQKRYGLQVLINKETNEFIGLCGLLLQDVDAEKHVEVGYHIFKKHWGKGYAPEAAKRFIEFAFENHQANSVISIIAINNFKSQRVATKNGLKKIKQTKWTDLDVFIFQIDNTN